MGGKHPAGYHKDYYEANEERLREYQAAYYQRNKDRIKAQQRENALLRQYGITVDEYDAMLEAQGGGCSVCGVGSGWAEKRLAVDHDHASGRVRGLLCDRCNTVLGKVGDDPALLDGLKLYLINNA